MATCPCDCGDPVRPGNRYAHRWCRWAIRPPALWLTKICARGGCTASVQAPGPKTLAAQKYCSSRCGAIDRLMRGWQPEQLLSAESRRRGGLNGGKVSAARRHETAIRARAVLVERMIPERFLEAMSDRDVRLLKVLLVRAVGRGYELGYHTAVAVRSAKRTKGRAA